MEILHLLEKLTQNCGVAGYEKPIADLLEDEIKDIGPVRRTPLGSLICTVKQEHLTNRMLCWKRTWTKRFDGM